MRTNVTRKSQRNNPTRERIIDAGLQMFGEKGFNGSTTKDIARSANVNEVTIFRLFKSKRELFEAVMVERSPLPLIMREISFSPDADIEDLFVQNAKAVLSILRSNKYLFMVMLRDAWRQPRTRSTISNVLMKKGTEFGAEFMRVQMERGRIRTMEPEIVARAWMGMVQAYFITGDLLEGRPSSPEDYERVLRGFASILLDGVRLEGR
jgi:AcrR family transcriptional regulator